MGDGRRHGIRRGGARDPGACQRGIRIDFEGDGDQRERQDDGHGSHGSIYRTRLRQNQSDNPAKSGSYISEGPRHRLSFSGGARACDPSLSRPSIFAGLMAPCQVQLPTAASYAQAFKGSEPPIPCTAPARGRPRSRCLGHRRDDRAADEVRVLGTSSPTIKGCSLIPDLPPAANYSVSVQVMACGSG